MVRVIGVVANKAGKVCSSTRRHKIKKAGYTQVQMCVTVYVVIPTAKRSLSDKNRETAAEVEII